MKLKSKITSLLFLFLGVSLQSFADTGNYVYCDNMLAQADGQFVLSVKLKNTVDIASFQFDLALPKGMSFATDANNKPICVFSTERVSSSMKQYFDFGLIGDTLRVLCTMTSGSNGALDSFLDNDGEIVQITINVDASVAPGDYTAYLKKVTLGDVNAERVKTEGTEFNITVVDGSLLDENSTIAPKATAKPGKVYVKRTIKAGTWSTICLPFAMTGEQVAAAFGSDVKIGDFTNWTEEYANDENEDPSSIDLEFTSVEATTSGLEANHPYIIKTAQDVKQFTVDGVTITPDEEPSVSVGSKRKGTLGSFTGNYVAGTLVPEANLFLTGNEFWYSVGKTKIKAFRGYFELMDVTKAYTEATTSSAKVNIVVDGSATGINSVKAAQPAGRVYSLSGTVVGDNLEALPHGVYIVNGKKIVK